MRILIALLAAIALSAAAAFDLPSDADIVLTAGDGTIVGIGKTVGGQEFELELLVGFDGFASLLVVSPGGDIQVLEVMVSDGTIYVDLVELTVLLAEAGFGDARIAVSGVVTMPSATERPSEPAAAGAEAAAEGIDAAEGGIGNAADDAHEALEEAEAEVDERAYEGADNADDVDLEEVTDPPTGRP